jgi:hypothetical protein
MVMGLRGLINLYEGLRYSLLPGSSSLMCFIRLRLLAEEQSSEDKRRDVEGQSQSTSFAYENAYKYPEREGIS